MTHAMRFGLDRPNGARGIVPLILAAMGARSLIGGIMGNQTKQRNKGYINANYRMAKEQLGVSQGLGRQNIAEDLNRRGISPVAQAMVGGVPDTLGGQVQSDAEHQFGLERQDLETKHNYALATNNADYMNSLVGSVASGATTAMQLAGASADMGAAQGGAAASSAPSPVASAMMSGGDVSPDVTHIGMGGVDAIDPLGNPASSWYSGGRGGKMTMSGAGLTNSDFNTAGVS